MGFQERLQWMMRMALLAFILASAAFLSALTAMRLAIQGREVVMPDLAGKMSREALVTLQGRGLGMKVEDRIYDGQSLDTIVRQSPPAGTRVKVGQFAHVVLSLGPQNVSIPSLSDKSLRAARIELLRSGLQIGEISEVPLSGAPEEMVLDQDPQPGTKGASSPHVDLLVAEPPVASAFVMPELSGLPLPEAEARLSAAGLKVAHVTYLPLTGASHGVVTSQLPYRGARVDSNSAVDLQVAE
jgi:eukaryotic-like serine/threonine-protein kinase